MSLEMRPTEEEILNGCIVPVPGNAECIREETFDREQTLPAAVCRCAPLSAVAIIPNPR
jgi:hypothetical protein